MSRIGEPAVSVGFDTWAYEKVEKRTNYEDMIAEMEERYGTPRRRGREASAAEAEHATPDEEIRPTGRL